MADRFFTPDALGIGEYTLAGPEAHHLTNVRRIGTGDRITLFNGDGCEYLSEVLATGKKNVVLNVFERVAIDRELSFSLILACAIPKADRADFLIEKLTELGVTRFIPLIVERSVVRPKASVIEKYQRAVIEASKQCGRNKLMGMEPPSDWDELILRQDLPGTRYILVPQAEVLTSSEPLNGVVVGIGPEGGFTHKELDKATSNNWQALGLGQRVLRVETAAIAAAVLLSLR
jgi:16S rRNA (uracil1498-N3)-methyltransferase